MAEPIISVSGLRGIVGETLTPQVAIRYVAAFAALAPEGPFVVGRDGRPSGMMLAAAVQSALMAAGRTAVDAGVAATPTLGVLVRSLGAGGGIQITASHNPAPYNGIKLFSREGRVIPGDRGQEVLDRYRSGPEVWVPFDRLGGCTTLADNHSDHLEAVLAQVDVEAIRARRFRVVLDSNHGAGSVLGLILLESLGCQLIPQGDSPDGLYDHPPEPTADNLQTVLGKVVEAEAAVGFCQDPDADRLALIDERGRYIGEEYTLALCVEHVLQQRHGPIVVNCATSRMSADIAARHGVPCHRAAVGEANVVDMMLRTGAVFGGEGNGGPIDPKVGWVRDSFVGMALVLDAMAQRNQPLSTMADALPRYEIVKTKYALPADKVAPAVAALRGRFGEAKCNTMDGLRLDWPDRWLLVRASNTEPIVRAIAEAPTAAEARALCDAAAEVLRGV
ncbi:MAG: phosphoglucosamine mutase [Planctomycetota bacterium]